MNTDKASVLSLIDSDIHHFECMVLQRLAYDREFFTKNLEILKTDPLGIPVDNFSKPENNAAFNVIATLSPLLGETPHYNEHLCASAFVVLANQGKYLSPGDAPAWASWLIQVLQMDYTLTLAVTEVGFIPWMTNKWHKLILTKARMESWDMDKMSEVMNLSREKLSSAGGNSTMMFSARDIRRGKRDYVTERFPTRLADFNAKTGGGPGRKEGWLFIGARGTGKSVAGANLGVDFIRNKRRGLVITTELPADELYYRIWSDMCNIPIRVIQDGINEARLQPQQLKELDEAEEVLSNLMRVYEWPRGSERSIITGLEADIAKAERALGGPLDWVVLDWIGGALGAAELDPGKIRLLYQYAADQMAWLAKSHDMVTVSLAQAHVDKGLRKSWVDDTALAECKQMGREMVGVVGITGMLSSEEEMEQGHSNFAKLQKWCIGKARKGAGGSVRVQRDFAFQRFKEA